MSTFFIEQQATIGAKVPLPKKEARHLSTVLRGNTGDQIRVMDPFGGRYEGTLTQEGKTLSVLIEKKLPPLPDPYPIHLFLSLLKRDKLEWVIQKSVELNIAAVYLVATERSIRQELSATHIKRLSRIAEEAQKQCGRAVPIKIFPGVTLPLTHVPGTHFLFDAEAGEGSLKSHLEGNASLCFPVGLWIGPEGGWTREEIAFARQNNFHLAHLGPLTLRAETAAIAAITSFTSIVF